VCNPHQFSRQSWKRRLDREIEVFFAPSSPAVCNIKYRIIEISFSTILMNFSHRKATELNSCAPEYCQAGSMTVSSHSGVPAH